MSILNLENPGNTYAGRIERLQIVRSDGSVRESHDVNIHNTIVDTGLDNLLTVGGFASGTDYNSKTLSINNYNTLCYDIGLTIRMLWYMAIGTDTQYNPTTYDMTNLVSPYTNENGEYYSQSHYIPTSADYTIRGTTDDSMIEGDIHSTHRITSNSIKASEDGVVITEVAFFVGINQTYNNDIAFTSQVYTPGDMFSRISLGEAHKVTLNKGERLVVTYALTEYAGASTHQAIDSLNLVDADGNEIKYKDSEGSYHTIGAIARCWMCDGKRANTGTGNYPLPGAFKGIHPTEGFGCTLGASSYIDNSVQYMCYKMSAYAYNGTYRPCGDYYTRISQYACWNAYACYNYVDNYPVMIARQANIRKRTDSTGGAYYHNQVDKYGFPTINGVTQYYGSPIAAYRESGDASSTHGAGRCSNNTSNPTPTGDWYSRYASVSTYPIVDTYYRCSTGNSKPASRSETFTIPTYHPIYCWGGAPSPSSTVGIWWLFVRGMIYKIGYYPEGKEGNLDDFVACPITKKAGQIMRIKFTETVARHSRT